MKFLPFSASFSLKSFLLRMISMALCLSLLFCCCACSGESRPENADQTITFHLGEDPSSLDPQIADSFASRVAVEALYEGLVRLDENGDVYPGAAESWDVSTDGRQYTFHLRKDAQWSKSIVTEDGETSVSSTPSPLTADDFVFAWRRAVDPTTKSPSASSFSLIKNASSIISGSLSPDQLGVSATDDHTLVVTLESPTEDFLRLTATTAFMPCQEDFFLWTSGRYGLEAKYVCGNGPFAFSNSYAWDHEEAMTLRRSSSYHGENEPLPASLKLYVSTKAADISNPVTAVAEETVDLASLPSSLLESAKEEDLQIYTLSMDAVWGLGFNTKDTLMKNVDIRKLFVQTLPRENLLENLPANATAANDIIPSTFLWNGESYRKQAGSNFYLKQDDSIVNTLPALLKKLKLDTMPSITVLGVTGLQQMLNQMLITWNGRMGNYFNLETMSEDEMNKRIADGDYQAAVYALRPDGNTPIDILSLFASDSTPALLQSSEYDRLLEAADAGDSLSALVDAETWLNQQVIFYPLYYTDRYYVANPTLTGVVIHSADMGIDFIQAGKLS